MVYFVCLRCFIVEFLSLLLIDWIFDIGLLAGRDPDSWATVCSNQWDRHWFTICRTRWLFLLCWVHFRKPSVVLFSRSIPWVLWRWWLFCMQAVQKDSGTRRHHSNWWVISQTGFWVRLISVLRSVRRVFVCRCTVGTFCVIFSLDTAAGCWWRWRTKRRSRWGEGFVGTILILDSGGV